MGAKSPALRSLSVETFDGVTDVPGLTQRLAEVLGPFLSDCAVAFDDLLGPNRREQIETQTITTNGSGLVVNLKFRSRLPVNPTVVLLGQCRPTSSSASTALELTCPVWRLGQDGLIYIDHIGGLSASTEYRLTFLVK